MKLLVPRRVHVYFTKLPGRQVGEAELATNCILIDLRKDHNPVITFLHELLHLQYPLAKEKDIERLALRIWRNMPDKERFKLGQRLFRRAYRSDEDD